MSEELEAGQEGHPEDYASQGTDALKKDQPLSRLEERLVDRKIQDLEQAHSQRVSLFKWVRNLVIGSIITVVIMVLLLGMGCLELDAPVAVAMITGLSAQPFILTGFLVSGLYGGRRARQADRAES